RLDHLPQHFDSPLANLPAHTDTPIALPEEALQQTLHPTNTIQVVLPRGEKHIDRSVAQVLNTVRGEDVMLLEHLLQKLVLEPRGGLTGVCKLNADLLRTLIAPMIEQTTAFLGELLPVTDVTEVEISTAHAIKVELAARIQDYHKRSTPSSQSTVEQTTFVVVPDSESGKAFAQVVKRTLPTALTIPVQGSATDLMFCR